MKLISGKSVFKPNQLKKKKMYNQWSEQYKKNLPCCEIKYIYVFCVFHDCFPNTLLYELRI